jgi:uncharacterized membrane protein YcaP (DUF421 family)
MTFAEWLKRLLIGDAPWLFLVEVAYRGAIVYIALLIAMRAMGKRIAAKFGIAELAIVLMLGAAISSPVQMPTQGILNAVVVLATLAALQRLVSWLSYRRRSIEVGVHGDVDCLLTDGRLRVDRMIATKISRDLLLSELRAEGITELGELRRVYIEAAGRLSLVRYNQPRPGLAIGPHMEGERWPACKAGGRTCCAHCGALDVPEGACPHCHHTRRTDASLPQDA